MFDVTMMISRSVLILGGQILSHGQDQAALRYGPNVLFGAFGWVKDGQKVSNICFKQAPQIMMYS